MISLLTYFLENIFSKNHFFKKEGNFLCFLIFFMSFRVIKGKLSSSIKYVNGRKNKEIC